MRAPGEAVAPLRGLPRDLPRRAHRDDLFYRCQRCENVLDEAPIEPVPRRVIEGRIVRAQYGQETEADRDSDLRIIDL